ncbi:unnamed protein product [Paramecium primaurelia]|uniref:MORN repeat protein n=1 Tax=Paramecium primaurelia TaxID=5886 RepID=A0A8S1KW20_PARPR|nr:unnamed protein product [Paramecium primaurelia]
MMIQQRQEDGMNQLIISEVDKDNHKQLTLVNIIMTKKLVDGIFCIRNIGKRTFKQCKIQKIKLFSGGGLYNDLGSIKIGNWIEVSENFGSRRGQSFVTYHGEYKNNKKVGKWDIWYKQFNNRWDSEQIGGGLYDQEGFFKIGLWIEVGDGFEMNLQIIQRGYYQNDEKVGRWDILYREWGSEKFENIGGGSYSEGGSFKIGKWIELVDGSLVSYICEYKDGKVISMQK